jgi:REP element-mobilizing transposase RayT
MRTVRILEEGAAYYHIVSRVVDRQMVFTPDEKERFRKLMRAVEGFSGVQILTYALMTNHWHILVYVPDRQEVGDEEFIRRLKYLYDGGMVDNLMNYLGRLRAEGQNEAADRLKADYTVRMYSLSEFVKTLKQRVSVSYNRRHQRKGTLWEERYKSVLVEGSSGALGAIAAYVDLNAVRAGLVADPKDYRFCGYGEAMGGGKEAREGLKKVMGEADWGEAAGRYRQMVYVTGEERGVGEGVRVKKKGFKAEEVDEVMERKGRLPMNEVLRCRVRYFTDGVIFGGSAFVEGAFRRHRSHFGSRREDGARVMAGGEWGDLVTARALRVSVIGSPVPA